MGTARKFWQDAKGRCPEWEDENLKEDLGPLLDKVEDALDTIEKSGGKLLPLVEKVHDSIGNSKRIGDRYKRELSTLGAWNEIRAYFDAGVTQAVTKLEQQQDQLLHRHIREAALEVNACNVKLSSMG